MVTGAGTARVAGLDGTAVGAWVRRLAGNTAPRRNHWRTRQLYYRAAATLLEAQQRPLTWKSIVAAAGPRGCRSTFYEVAGAHARHRMVDDLIGDGRPGAIEIAWRYLRSDAVEQLLDETKVWSFWPYRQELMRWFSDAMTLGELEAGLSQTVLAWGREHPALAGAVGFAPPACAVEDLTVLHQGHLSGTQALHRLSEVIRKG
ncbi:hypothetical protein QLQ12_33000 [Actinoplanes sp. NEAU-A12]|uniref:TetR family transcriptional regulator n=1 Tax=Actinoplanes sandaracinus TaxID=3045177 RepID=A0ABT6WUN9_9ACTN|nr:hypothetical protein [Actinoplanes sandaracinus]MDI6103438.1 hypothetical protein [Actinoplanes sandaracinus]